MRSTDGYSKHVHAGNGLFTLLGFMGLYAILAVLFVVLVLRIISEGPGERRAVEVTSGAPLTTV